MGSLITNYVLWEQKEYLLCPLVFRPIPKSFYVPEKSETRLALSIYEDVRPQSSADLFGQLTRHTEALSRCLGRFVDGSASLTPYDRLSVRRGYI
jgi:hypothetical protein